MDGKWERLGGGDFGVVRFRVGNEDTRVSALDESSETRLSRGASR